jgi:hypothetical protein
MPTSNLAKQEGAEQACLLLLLGSQHSLPMCFAAARQQSVGQLHSLSLLLAVPLSTTLLPYRYDSRDPCTAVAGAFVGSAA